MKIAPGFPSAGLPGDPVGLREVLGLEQAGPGLAAPGVVAGEALAVAEHPGEGVGELHRVVGPLSDPGDQLLERRRRRRRLGPPGRQPGQLPGQDRVRDRQCDQLLPGQMTREWAWAFNRLLLSFCSSLHAYVFCGG